MYNILLYTTYYHGITAYNPTASNAPTIGPTIGTHAYPIFELPLPLIGRIACAKRGPKSLAGLIAYPVNPPSDIPIETMIANTRSFPTPGSTSPTCAKPLIANTSTKVPTASLKKFNTGFGIEGPVQNTPSFVPASSVASN